MADHRATHRGAGRRRRPARLRALLGLGVALGLGATGTLAAWTDDVTISGTTFKAGTLDLQVKDSDVPATATLSMAQMVPGSSSAEVLLVKNNNTVPLKYTLTGGLTGAEAEAFSGQLKLTIRLNGSKAGTGIASTCSGGSLLVDNRPLTDVTSASIIGTRRPTVALARDATESLCFQVTFDSGAPSSLQGMSVDATFRATGTSDVS